MLRCVVGCLAEDPDVYVPSAPPQQQTVVEAVPVGAAPAPSAPAVYEYQQPTSSPPGQNPQYATPPPPGAPPAAGVAPVAPVNMAGLGKDPKRITCPYCHQQVVTRTTSEIDACSIVAVVVLLLTIWPLFWIPLVCDCCKAMNHHCPSCHRKVRIEMMHSCILLALILHYTLVGVLMADAWYGTMSHLNFFAALSNSLMTIRSAPSLGAKMEERAFDSVCVNVFSQLVERVMEPRKSNIVRNIS